MSTNIKKLYVWNSIFKKTISNMTFWIMVQILVQVYLFRRLLQGVLVKFFFAGQSWWPTFTQPPPTTHHPLHTHTHTSTHAHPKRLPTVLFEMTSFLLTWKMKWFGCARWKGSHNHPCTELLLQKMTSQKLYHVV